VLFAESGINPVQDIDAGAKDLLQLWKVGLLSGVQGAGYLVDIVTDPPHLAEMLAERLVVDGRAALGAGSGVAVEDGGTQEGS